MQDVAQKRGKMPLTERQIVCREQILSEAYADYILETNSELESLKEVLEIQCGQPIGGRFQMLHGPETNVLNYYSIPKLFGLMQENGAEAANAIRLQTQPNLQLRGQNTIIGIVDTGIDYRLSAFRTPGGRTRILRIWDQNIQSDSVPEEFYYGTEYTQEEIDLALQSEQPLDIVPSIDENGHGSFLAGVAAGTPDAAANFTGVVPEAMIAVVKLKPAKNYLRNYFMVKEGAEAYQETDIMLGVRYLVELAMKQKRPVVIMLGLGSNQGNHSGSMPLARVLDYYSTFGGIGVVVPTGNEGDKQHHFAGRLSAVEQYEEVEVNVGENERGFTMELWGVAPDLFSIGVVTPSGETIPRIPIGLQLDQRFTFLLEPTELFVTYRVAEVQSGSQLIQMRFRNPSPGIWRIRVYGSNLVNQTYHMWLPISAFVESDTLFLKSSPDMTITEPGNAKNPITAGGYNNLQNGIYSASGRGYTMDGLIKPEFASPSVQIIGPNLRNGYSTMTATSVGMAVAAGALAQFFQWGIVQAHQVTMRTVDAKNYLIRGAKRTDPMQYPNPLTGWGRLDVYGAFEALIRDQMF